MEQNKSVYKVAAECGIPLGVLMSLISLCFIYFDCVPILSLVVIILLALGPLVVYRYQRRYFVSLGGNASYSTLWLQGVLMVFFGALISGLVTLLILQYVRPTWVYDMVQNTLESFNTMPQDSVKSMQPMIDEMRKMAESGLLPTPTQYVVQMFWSVMVSGALMSAITAAFASRPINNNLNINITINKKNNL